MCVLFEHLSCQMICTQFSVSLYNNMRGACKMQVNLKEKCEMFAVQMLNNKYHEVFKLAEFLLCGKPFLCFDPSHSLSTFLFFSRNCQRYFHHLCFAWIFPPFPLLDLPLILGSQTEKCTSQT